MLVPSLSVFAVTGIGEVRPGDSLAEAICANAVLADGDVLVVTQKIVSKAEGRIVEVDASDAEAKLRLALSESVRVLRRRGDLVITETRHGFVCANSGVDLSNVPDGYAVLLPVDPDRSATSIRRAVAHTAHVNVGVIISDTFGRAWRKGLTDVAIGCSGIAAVVDLRGETDALGRELVATEVCIADELTGAAELAMGKANGIPVAVIRGVDPVHLRESSVRSEIVRPPAEDLFR